MANHSVMSVGPRPYWVLGNLADFVRKGAHKVFAEWNAKHGSIYVVRFICLVFCKLVCALGTSYYCRRAAIGGAEALDVPLIALSLRR